MGASGSVVKATHVVFGVPDYKLLKFVAAETKEHAEAVAKFDFRAFHVWRVIRGLMIVVFEHTDTSVQLRARDEYHANPVINHPCGANDGACRCRGW